MSNQKLLITDAIMSEFQLRIREHAPTIAFGAPPSSMTVRRYILTTTRDTVYIGPNYLDADKITQILQVADAKPWLLLRSVPNGSLLPRVTIRFEDQYAEYSPLWEPNPLMASELLAQIPSRSSKDTTYKVQRDDTGIIWCNCPGYLNSRRVPKSCRHTLVFEALMSESAIRPGEPIPTKAPDRILTKDELKAQGALAADQPLSVPARNPERLSQSEQAAVQIANAGLPTKTARGRAGYYLSDPLNDRTIKIFYAAWQRFINDRVRATDETLFREYISPNQTYMRFEDGDVSRYKGLVQIIENKGSLMEYTLLNVATNTSLGPYALRGVLAGLKGGVFVPVRPRQVRKAKKIESPNLETLMDFQKNASDRKTSTITVESTISKTRVILFEDDE